MLVVALFVVAIAVLSFLWYRDHTKLKSAAADERVGLEAQVAAANKRWESVRREQWVQNEVPLLVKDKTAHAVANEVTSLIFDTPAISGRQK
jgi:hypothetical protein